jgi:hypothetical protein
VSLLLALLLLLLLQLGHNQGCSHNIEDAGTSAVNN